MIRKKYIHLWLQFKGCKDPSAFFGGMLNSSNMETPQRGGYFERTFGGSYVPFWREQAIDRMREGLAQCQRDWNDITYVHCYYEDFPLENWVPMTFKDGFLYLGYIEQAIPGIWWSEFKDKFRDASTIEEMENAFEGTPFTPLEFLNDNDENLLHLAIRNDNVTFAKGLLEYGFSATAPNKFSPPIVNAKSVDMARLLLDHGATIDIVANYKGPGLVFIAARHANLDLVKFYLDQGAAPCFTASPENKVYPFINVSAKHIPCIAFWLEQGMDIHHLDAMYGRTMLQSAIKRGDEKLKTFLISRGAEQ